MLNIDEIQNGIVIDHIQAGTSMHLYDLMGLDSLDCGVAIIRNVRSNKMGKKDMCLPMQKRAVSAMWKNATGIRHR